MEGRRSARNNDSPAAAKPGSSAQKNTSPVRSASKTSKDRASSSVRASSAGKTRESSLAKSNNSEGLPTTPGGDEELQTSMDSLASSFKAGGIRFTAEQDEMLRTVFDVCDIRGNGEVSFSDLYFVLSAFGLKVEESSLEQCFDAVNTVSAQVVDSIDQLTGSEEKKEEKRRVKLKGFMDLVAHCSSVSREQMNCTPIEARRILQSKFFERSRHEVQALTSYLRAVQPFFRQVRTDVTEQLCKYVGFQRCQRGEMIITQGDTGDTMYAILSGSCEVLFKEASEAPKTPNAVKPNRVKKGRKADEQIPAEGSGNEKGENKHSQEAPSDNEGGLRSPAAVQHRPVPGDEGGPLPVVDGTVQEQPQPRGRAASVVSPEKMTEFRRQTMTRRKTRRESIIKMASIKLAKEVIQGPEGGDSQSTGEEGGSTEEGEKGSDGQATAEQTPAAEASPADSGTNTPQAEPLARRGRQGSFERRSTFRKSSFNNKLSAKLEETAAAPAAPKEVEAPAPAETKSKAEEEEGTEEKTPESGSDDEEKDEEKNEDDEEHGEHAVAQKRKIKALSQRWTNAVRKISAVGAKLLAGVNSIPEDMEATSGLATPENLDWDPEHPGLTYLEELLQKPRLQVLRKLTTKHVEGVSKNITEEQLELLDVLERHLEETIKGPVQIDKDTLPVLEEYWMTEVKQMVPMDAPVALLHLVAQIAHRIGLIRLNQHFRREARGTDSLTAMQQAFAGDARLEKADDVLLEAAHLTYDDLMHYGALKTEPELAASVPPGWAGKRVGLCREGDTFGELALMEADTKRTASVRVVEDCEVLTLDRLTFNRILRTDQGRLMYEPTFCQTLLEKRPQDRTELDIKKLSMFVSHLPVLKDLGEKMRTQLVRTMLYERRPPGHVICRQGDKGDALYIIFQGKANVHINPQLRNKEVRDKEKEKHASPEPKGKWNTVKSKVSGVSAANWLQTKSTNRKLPFQRKGSSTEHDEMFGPCVKQLETGSSFGEIVLFKPNQTRTATVICDCETSLIVIKKVHYNATLRDVQRSQMADKLNFLRRIAICSSLNEDELMQLNFYLHKQALSRGTVIAHQGSKPSGLFFIESGSIKVLRIKQAQGDGKHTTSSTGIGGFGDGGQAVLENHPIANRVYNPQKYQEVALLGVGDYFGEETVDLSTRYEHTFMANSETELLRLHPSDYNKLCVAAQKALVSYQEVRHHWRSSRPPESSAQTLLPALKSGPEEESPQKGRGERGAAAKNQPVRDLLGNLLGESPEYIPMEPKTSVVAARTDKRHMACSNMSPGEAAGSPKRQRPPPEPEDSDFSASSAVPLDRKPAPDPAASALQAQHSLPLAAGRSQEEIDEYRTLLAKPSKVGDTVSRQERLRMSSPVNTANDYMLQLQRSVESQRASEEDAESLRQSQAESPSRGAERDQKLTSEGSANSAASWGHSSRGGASPAPTRHRARPGLMDMHEIYGHDNVTMATKHMKRIGDASWATHALPASVSAPDIGIPRPHTVTAAFDPDLGPPSPTYSQTLSPAPKPMGIGPLMVPPGSVQIATKLEPSPSSPELPLRPLQGAPRYSSPSHLTDSSAEPSTTHLSPHRSEAMLNIPRHVPVYHLARTSKMAQLPAIVPQPAKRNPWMGTPGPMGARRIPIGTSSPERRNPHVVVKVGGRGVLVSQ